MIGQVPPANPAPPQFRTEPARAPVQRLPRQLDLLGAKPDRPVEPLPPIGALGARIDLRA